MNVFPPRSQEEFCRNYPEVAHRFVHNLNEHPMLSLEALARLAELMPADLLECNAADQPIGVDALPEQTLDNIGDRIRNIGEAGSWVGLRRVEHDPAYEKLLWELLSDVRPEVENKTGAIFDLQGFIFVSSPGSVTPYHFDPEHNILLQIQGTKTMTVFPAGDPAFASDELHETYHTGGRPELPWRGELAAGGTDWSLRPGEAIYVPVMAPHYVRNGDDISISISVTWKSEWSHAEADARALNKLLRKAGLNPAAPGRWPARNRSKSYAWRALRKIRAVG